MAEPRLPSMRPGEKSRYVPDNKSFGAFILSEQVRDVTTDVSQDMAKLAAAYTPVGDGDNGHMKDKWEVQREGGVLKVSGNVRVMVLVENLDPEAALVEFGSVHNKRTRMAARAGSHFGDFKGKGEVPA